MAKKKPQTVPVFVRLPKPIKDALDQLARKHRRNKSTEIVIALEEYLAKHGMWEIEIPPSEDDL